MTGLSVSSPVVQQLAAFLEAAALGALFAFFYDLYRAVRMQFRRLPSVLSVAADCFFWIAAAAAAILFLVYRRWGEIHIYIYIGLAGGFMIYLHYLSKYLLPLWQKGCGYFVRLCRRLAEDGREKK